MATDVLASRPVAQTLQKEIREHLTNDWATPEAIGARIYETRIREGRIGLLARIFLYLNLRPVAQFCEQPSPERIHRTLTYLHRESLATTEWRTPTPEQVELREAHLANVWKRSPVVLRGS